MQYRKFGKTGVEVSALGFGAMRLPTIGGKMDSVDEKATEEMLRYAIEHGVNYVDTAYVYHGGAGEKAIGKILKRGLREKVNLATKLPTWMVTSRKDMDRYLNEQLERLQTDHIDFYLAHGLSKERWSHLESLGFIDFIEAAKKDGRITYAGFSYHDEPQNFRPIVDACRWDFCQIQFNFMDTAYQAGLKGLRYAGKKGLGLVIMEPLKGGQLTGSVPPAIQKVWARAKVKRSPAEWGLRFVWDYEEPSVVLSGMSTLEQVKENVRLADTANPGTLTKAEKALIGEVRKAYKSMVAVGCTGCKYCMPCPNGVDIPGNFSMLNNATMFGSLSAMKASYNEFMQESERASSCVKCGECEEKCPQHLPIREKLEEVVKALG